MEGRNADMTIRVRVRRAEGHTDIPEHSLVV